MISFMCPKCRTPYTAPDETAGRQTSCRTCRKAFLVPARGRGRGSKRGMLLMFAFLVVSLAAFAGGVIATLGFQKLAGTGAVAKVATAAAEAKPSQLATIEAKATEPPKTEVVPKTQEVPKQEEVKQPEPKSDSPQPGPPQTSKQPGPPPATKQKDPTPEDTIITVGLQSVRKRWPNYEELQILGAVPPWPYEIEDRMGALASYYNEQPRNKRMFRSMAVVIVRYKRFPDEKPRLEVVVVINGRVRGSSEIEEDKPVTEADFQQFLRELRENGDVARVPKTPEERARVMRSAAGFPGPTFAE